MLQRKGQFIQVDQVFGGIEPKQHYQNLNTGKSNIEGATTAWYRFNGFNVRNHGD